jgi:hypothetical protein
MAKKNGWLLHMPSNGAGQRTTGHIMVQEYGTEEKFVKVMVLDSAVESQLVMSILDEQHIPYRFRSFHDTAYDGIFQVQKGWGEISAPASRKGQILEIVEDIRSKNMDKDVFD